MRLVIISNRLPLTLSSDKPGPRLYKSVGGLVTGLESFIESIDRRQTAFDDHLWIGWPGAPVKKGNQAEFSRECLERYKYYPVYLTEKVIEDFYYGYCNRVIWPLFHDFPDKVSHDHDIWENYKNANIAFLSAVKQVLREDDVVWIQDYHLMLLPSLIRKEFPKAVISFFLHVPFPELSIFQHLSGPAKEGILNGLLGADVIGFHTSSYTQNFLKCALSVLKIPNISNKVLVDKRTIRVDFFPMGIDYKKISAIAQSDECICIRNSIRNSFPKMKIILSIDRLDYTKGILNRLIAFDAFLTNFPAWRAKVVLMLIVAPSRREIYDYQLMKRQIDEWVGKINGTHSTNSWTPVIYQYRQLGFLELCALYGAGDVGLITPLKDGMNLIAKEFVASHTDREGVLVLSEMAGAIHELSEAIALNPFKVEEIVQALARALKMSMSEQYLRNEKMHKRLCSYDVDTWAGEIMGVTIGSGNRIPVPPPLEGNLLKYTENIKNPH